MEAFPDSGKLEHSQQSENTECADCIQTNPDIFVDLVNDDLNQAEDDYHKVEDAETVLEVEMKADTKHFDNHLHEEDKEEQHIQVVVRDFKSWTLRILINAQNDCVSHDAE
jgi:hypothetical protein